MRRKALVYFICTVLLTALLAVTVYADIGPKASVQITFENMGEEECWGTLLSDKRSNGPQAMWDGTEEDMYLGDLEYDIWEAFAEYKDSADGYCFLQLAWQVSETKELAWTYMPPSSFKILLYYPESGTFKVSGIYERYAFDTYYSVDMSGAETLLTAERAYDHTWEMISLLCRIVLTVLIELGVALLFGLRSRKQLVTVMWVNSATQILLNVLLNVINYRSGSLAFTFYYIVFELAVFIIEGVLYGFLLELEPDEKTRAWGYSFAANALSFIAGLLLAHIIPGIF